MEEKRRSLPIYQHYTLSPGKTKSHHPEAKCNHCLKEFVCGSKQRLIRHLRKCNSISNPEQIIAETLNTLARNSATGTLNHSILEASNLLPSQISSHLHNPVVTHLQHQQQQQLISHQLQHQQHHHHHHHNHLHSASSSSSLPSTTANSSINNTNNDNSLNISSNNLSNHNTSGSSCNEAVLLASSSNGSGSTLIAASLHNANVSSPNNNNNNKRPQRRGRRANNQSLANNGSGIHVTTGLDGKTHFTPASQLPPNLSATVGAPLIQQVAHSGRQIGFTYHTSAVSTSPVGAAIIGSGSHHHHPNNAPAHLACANSSHHHPATAFKLNSEPSDRAYLKLVLTRNLPISLCDTREFQSWVKTFANDYKPPSSTNLIAQNLKNEAQASRQRIFNMIAKASKKTINLELHCWPDNIREHLWFAIVANLDQRRFLISIRDIQSQSHSNFINTNSSNSFHQSDRNLAMFIDDCIKRVGSDRINSLVFSGSIENDVLTIQSRQSLYTSHPSIITYTCWWHYTNLLCSDIIEQNDMFQLVMRNSNRLINFISKRPRLCQNLEKFSPFGNVMSCAVVPQKTDRRWYSHLVCYLLEYIKNNIEAIHEALNACSIPNIQTHSSSDNNNNSSPVASGDTSSIIQHTTTLTSTQNQPIDIFHEDDHLSAIKSIVSSLEFRENLSLALAYLKPIYDIAALTKIPNLNLVNNVISGTSSNSATPNPEVLPAINNHQTSFISPNVANSISLGDYMDWFLYYGRNLLDSWRQSPDVYKYHLIGSYLSRFSSSIPEFKLLFAAYLLNPKHRCAYITQKAKNLAIEEILNIASEFMPEESDGHTIFDQWKLYLVREEPYDVVFEESRTSPLEWWMSLPCAESIRRVALRILRLKAFTSPKPKSMFLQLYYYEDEVKQSLPASTFEDIAILRYFYDHEDKVSQNLPPSYGSSNVNPLTTNSANSNGYHDRTHAGQLHNQHTNESNNPISYLPTGSYDNRQQTNGQLSDSLNINDNRLNDSYSDVIVESYINHHSHMNLDAQSTSLGSTTGLTLENLPNYDIFTQYIDFSDCGVQVVVEEPLEKKKRKWTAQEILSKCQMNHTNHNNNNTNQTNK